MNTLPTHMPWSGAYIRDALGVEIATDTARSLLPVEALVGLALRHNPKRAHLLVSRVLAKHVPTEPGIVIAAGQLLGFLVRRELQLPADTDALGALIEEAADQLGKLLASDGGNGPVGERQDRQKRQAAVAALCDLLAAERPELPDTVTLGYAETATGLGQLVAEHLGTYYLHSTRQESQGVAPYGAFEEAHSHATSHQLLPTSRAALALAETVVLVDDELSTGATIINTIRELHATAPHRRYVVASLVDLRTAADRDRLAGLAHDLGTHISSVALAQGSIELPAYLAADAATLLATLPPPESEAGPGNAPEYVPGTLEHLNLGGIVAPIRSARFGVAGRPDPEVAQRIANALDAALSTTETSSSTGANSSTETHPGTQPNPGTHPGRSILVLATEEFMALPLTVAARLQQLRPDDTIRYSTSTRSPIAAVDTPGYAIRSAVAFASAGDSADGQGPRFAYNLSHPEGRFDTVLIMAEPGTAEAGLLSPGTITNAVAAVSGDVRLVTLDAQEPFPTPLTGPAFGSYLAADVQWLLKDLSFAKLEAPKEEREAAIQSGKASYAESLPQEYEPSADYSALYQSALEANASRIAHAVGTLTEQVLRLRGNTPVLVSLARAGTPVGILMKKWAREIHGLDLPHYALSIVRGLGIDQTALGYLASRHRPEDIMFVDGWTGKGAIARELADAVELFRSTDGADFRPDLAVLADPGHSVRIFGTREDYLVPSACLNSTVSGLVSRTVFNKALIRPGDFHGAKFYSELAGSDVSRDFLAAITRQFGTVREEVLEAAGDAPSTVAELPEADWSGWAAVEEISASFGINNVNLVKPGVGETTRVLLRRVPWKVLVRPEAVPELAHVLHLAEQRGVEVQGVPGLAYSCVGLIHPLHTPGATGADGKAVVDV